MPKTAAQFTVNDVGDPEAGQWAGSNASRLRRTRTLLGGLVNGCYEYREPLTVHGPKVPARRTLLSREQATLDGDRDKSSDTLPQNPGRARQLSTNTRTTVRVNPQENPVMLRWYKAAGRDDLLAGFDVDDEALSKELKLAAQYHPAYSELERRAWAAYNVAPPKPAGRSASEFWLWAWRIAVLGCLLALVGAAFAQTPHDPILLRGKDEGVALAGSTRAAGLWEINCSGSGVSCSWAGNTMTVSVAGGGACFSIVKP